MLKCIFLDTETTSYNADKCGLFQVSGIVDCEGTAIEEFNIFSDIFNDDEVMEDAFEKNKYSLEKIHKLPHPLKSFSKFLNLLRKHIEQYNKTDKFFVVGYNIRTFDEPVLRRWFSQNGSKWYGSFFWNPSIDVMDIAAYTLMNHRHELENFRLPTVARYLGIEFNEEEAHDGLYDARITREMYYNLIGEEMK